MDYRAKQIERIKASAQKVDAQEHTRPGRVVPEANDLAINEGRCMEAAILFLDISGFTSRAQETEEEQDLMLRALAIFFTEMIKIVEDFGGTVEKNTGDGLMAYFVKKPSSDHTASYLAVYAALTMFKAAQSVINGILEARGIKPFDFRICIDSGTVTIARLGAARRFNDIVAIGTVANLACKMLNIAQGGQLMIGNNVARELPTQWHEFLTPSTYETGYIYQRTGIAYSYWYYTGRLIK
ncbi:adenylate/guanylate cyclase domain-containing protein [Xanthomonas euvesicatoria]|uniref:adenylate/guanylate cyclase domain-containing protein n=1 Tax=Xanthomonas TaxID=338 RepID=UPI00131E4943|nr:adenylate/guanylate cyclase domain-containing protein [Xanthomonas euvesicatoria]